MPFSVAWNGSRYAARFWRSGYKDTDRLVPRDLWPEYGLREPDAPSVKHERVALRWAAEMAPSILGARRTTEMGIGEVFAMMVRENPRAVGESTRAKWAVDFANLKRHIPEVTPPSDVDEVTATRYRNARQTEKPTPRARTIHNELAFLRQLVLFAHRWRKVTGTNAVNLVDLPELADDESNSVALTEAEVAHLLATPTANNPERNAAWLVVGIATMLRRKNLLGLRGEWIDRAESWLRIPAGEMKGKTKRELSIPVAASALAVMPDVATGPLWINPQTGRSYVWVDEVLSGWVTASGVRPFSLHDLRTTGNSWLQSRGVDEFTRAALLGHSRAEGGTIRRSGSVTDGYTKVYRENLRAAVAIFDDIFGKIIVKHSPNNPPEVRTEERTEE